MLSTKAAAAGADPIARFDVDLFNHAVERSRDRQVVHGGHRLFKRDLCQAHILLLLRDGVRVGAGQQLVVPGLRFLKRRLRAGQGQFGFEDVVFGRRFQ